MQHNPSSPYRSGWLLLLWLIALFWTAPSWAIPSEIPFGAASRVPDDELAEMRGGILLPNGVDLAIGVEINTLIDGRLALRTVLTSSDITAPNISIFTENTSNVETSVASEGNPAVAVPATPIQAVPSPSVRVVIGEASPSSSPAGQTPVTVVANGPPAVTGWGNVELRQNDRGSIVILTGPDISIQQMVGAATGILLANTANNRTIDTTTTINLDLQNSSIPMGNMMLRVESVAMDAVGLRSY